MFDKNNTQPDELTPLVNIKEPTSSSKASLINPTTLIDSIENIPQIVHHVLPKPKNIISGTKDSLLSVQKPTHDALELSIIHQIDINPYERERLLSEHPQEIDVITRSRVKGSLQPTRAFGDGAYKNINLYKAKMELRGKSTTNIDKLWHPPYITAEPDITEYRLHQDDEFLVLSSDGLYNDLTPQEVVTYVGEFLANKNLQKRYKDNCATYLIERALVAASQQEIGRQNIDTALSWIFSVPKQIRRYIHDDITVQVICFGSHVIDKSVEQPQCTPVSPPPTLQAILNVSESSQQPRARL